METYKISKQNDQYTLILLVSIYEPFIIILQSIARYLYGAIVFITVNPYLTNGFFHHYHLGESTLIFRGVRSDFYFLSRCSTKFL